MLRQNITTLDVRKRLGELLDRVALRRDHFIISRRGRPLAAIVSLEQMEQLQRAAKLHLLDVLDRPGKAVSAAEADKLADEAKHRSRRRRR